MNTHFPLSFILVYALLVNFLYLTQYVHPLPYVNICIGTKWRRASWYSGWPAIIGCPIYRLLSWWCWRSSILVHAACGNAQTTWDAWHGRQWFITVWAWKKQYWSLSGHDTSELSCYFPNTDSLNIYFGQYLIWRWDRLAHRFGRCCHAFLYIPPSLRHCNSALSSVRDAECSLHGYFSTFQKNVHFTAWTPFQRWQGLSSCSSGLISFSKYYEALVLLNKAHTSLQEPQADLNRSSSADTTATSSRKFVTRTYLECAKTWAQSKSNSATLKIRSDAEQDMCQAVAGYFTRLQLLLDAEQQNH